jgi:hypothetical protein
MLIYIYIVLVGHNSDLFQSHALSIFLLRWYVDYINFNTNAYISVLECVVNILFYIYIHIIFWWFAYI